MCNFPVGTQDGEEEDFKDLAEEDEEEDEEERFVDADKLEEESETQSAVTEEAKPTASWVHHKNLEGLGAALRLITYHVVCSVVVMGVNRCGGIN